MHPMNLVSFRLFRKNLGDLQNVLSKWFTAPRPPPRGKITRRPIRTYFQGTKRFRIRRMRFFYRIVMKKYIPQKNINGRWNVPWLTNSIKRMTRKRQRLYNKARSTDNPGDWKKFKEMRKCIRKQLTTADFTRKKLKFSPKKFSAGF